MWCVGDICISVCLWGLSGASERCTVQLQRSAGLRSPGTARDMLSSLHCSYRHQAGAGGFWQEAIVFVPHKGHSCCCGEKGLEGGQEPGRKRGQTEALSVIQVGEGGVN